MQLLKFYLNDIDPFLKITTILFAMSTFDWHIIALSVLMPHLHLRGFYGARRLPASPFPCGLCAEVATSVRSYGFTSSAAFTILFKNGIHIFFNCKPVARRQIVLTLHNPRTCIVRRPLDYCAENVWFSVDVLPNQIVQPLHRSRSEAARARSYRMAPVASVN